jgi:hypothetical protein
MSNQSKQVSKPTLSAVIAKTAGIGSTKESSLVIRGQIKRDVPGVAAWPIHMPSTIPTLPLPNSTQN